ncbi:MAG: hemerythrin domain-containing protein [Deltaproteobacteria bacterium]|nr:hemerythrin domain-containing protein [Deltaproteobacteria bacterium]
MRHPSLIRLSHDHHHGLALALRCRRQALGQMKPTGVQGLRERADELTKFFSQNLERHFQAEEEILFPLIRSCAPESHPLMEDLLKEHEQIRKGVGRLEGDASLSKILFDLGDLLERHIRREERELFPLFESRVPAVQAEEAKGRIEKILLARDV